MGKINLTQVDFENYVEAICDYLNSQAEFSDYNFKGSGLSVLIDILAYNAVQNGFYLNMVANESFLDSSVLRKSAVGIAKHLGYTPRSVRSARASLRLTIDPDGLPDSITIPKGTLFTTNLNSKTYNFTVREAVVVLPTDETQYRVSEIEVVEGVVLTHRYTVGEVDTYVIPNASVDTSVLTVKVQNSSVDTTTVVYTLSEDITEIGSDDTVYWLHENYDQRFQIQFGNGTIGKALEDGNIVIIEYLVSAGEDANGCSSFAYASTVADIDDIDVETLLVGYGGASEEDIDSIKFLAPLSYESQNRAVTRQDYETLIKRDYPNIDAIRVWGGEDNIPPVYGKVFVAIKPVDGFVLSTAEKEYLVDTIIQRRSVLSIQSEVVDPEYIYLLIDSEVNYKSGLTSLTEGEIRNLILSTITDYADTELNQFDKHLKHSRLVAAIDDADTSIQSNTTSITLKYLLEAELDVETTYTIYFSNELSKGDVTNSDYCVSSDAFILDGYTCYFSDDGTGNVIIYRLLNGSRVIVNDSIGTIDYSTGTVVIESFSPESIVSDETYIQLYATPKYNNISCVRNQILIADESDITITLTNEQI
jgi:hypothetical protein